MIFQSPIRGCRTRILIWFVAISTSLFGPEFLGQLSLAGDNVWSVKKLNENKPWERLADVSLRIEGRVGTTSGALLKLVRCDANFKIENPKFRIAASKNNVELKGKFKKDGTSLFFVVDDLKVVSSYLEQYGVRASKLKRPTPDEWIELGDWAAERGHLYEDADLLKKSDEAYSNAVEVEYKSLKPSDAEGRFALAEKIKGFKLSARRQLELIHEAFRIQWQAAQKTEPADPDSWKKLSTSLGNQLPGTDVPLKMVAPDLKETYEQDPISTYKKADDKSRTQLHRLFFVAITRKRLLFGESSDGRDGDQIADQIDKLIPEEHALAEKLRMTKLNFRLANIVRETRVGVENLAMAFREHNLDDSAKQALVQWIKSHEPRLKSDGIVGLLQLSDEHLQLLNDEPTAVEYLNDAYRIDPSFEDVKTKFAALGYQWKNSRWIKTNAVGQESMTPVPQAPNMISLNMTASSLRTFLGQPRSLARAFTSKGLTEVWSYGPVGSTGLVVRLEQNDRNTEPKVTAYSGQ